MPTLTIDNEVNVTNVNGINLTVVPIKSRNLSILTLSGPKGDTGPAGTGSVAALTAEYPLFYDSTSGKIGIYSGYYPTFTDLLATSGALVSQISSSGGGTPTSFVISQLVYVNKSGQDGVGRGAFDKPFLTPQAALNSINDADFNRLYGISYGPGSYSPSSGEPLILKSYVYHIAEDRELTTITHNLLYSGNGGEFGFNSISLNGQTANFVRTAGENSFNISLFDCRTNPYFNGEIRVEAWNSIGRFAIKQGTSVLQNFKGVLYVGEPSSNFSVETKVFGGLIQSLGVYGNSNFGNVDLYLANVPVMGGEVITNTSNVQIFHDSSVDIRNITDFSQASSYATDSAEGINYYPANTEFWSGSPLYIQLNVAIDELAARGKSLSTDIESTGSNLYNLLVNESGELNNSIAKSISGLISSGQANSSYYPLNSNPSGYITENQTGQFYLASNPQRFSTSGDLFQSGLALLSIIGVTGQQAWLAAQNNAINLSGNLFNTGSILSSRVNLLSGNLTSSGQALLIAIASTGQQAWSAAQNNATNLSGALTLSGQALIARDLLTSGELSSRLTNTGQNLLNTIAQTGQQSWNAANNNALNLSGNLNQSGLLLINRDNLISGWLTSGLSNTGQQAWIAANNGDLNLSGNLNASGRRAWDDANNLSGRLTASGAILSAFQATGSQILQNVNLSGLGGTFILVSGNFVLISGASQSSQIQNNGDGINLSGNLSATGNTLFQRDLQISGYLASLISANSAGVSSLNGLSGSVNIVGTGSIISITNVGQFIFVSGNNNDAINLSGRIASTGQQAWLAAQNNAINLSGNDAAISGNLITSGQTLLLLIANTGSQAWNAANSNAINLSGNYSSLSGSLVSSGQALLLTISQTGQQAWNAANNNALNISGNLFNTGANLSAIRITGSNIVQSLNLSGLGNVSISLLAGGFAVISTNNNDAINLSGAIASSGSQAWNAANNNGINLSGRLTATGAFIAIVSGALESRIFQTGQANVIYTDLRVSQTGQASVNYIDLRISQTGQQAWLALNGGDTNLSGSLTNTGQILLGLIASSGSQSWNAANNNGINLSGNLSSTGAILFQRDLDISGALVAQIVGGGGTIVRVTGSTNLSIADFTGYGTTLVFVSGNKVFISGATAGGGAGVSSINGLTNAVTLRGTGNFSVVTIGQNLIVSGSNITQDKQVLFDGGGFTTGNDAFQWNYMTGALVIGNVATLLPDNPLAVVGSGNTYVQINLQNKASGFNAQADYVLTADIGTDTSNFLDLGINNSRFSNTGYQLYKPLDGFLYINGGDMHLGTSTPSKVLKFHVGGIQSGDLIATVNKSGISIPDGLNTGIRFGETMVSIQSYAKKAHIDIIQENIDRIVLQPAMWNRQFTAFLPSTASAQFTMGNTTAIGGTLSTASDQFQGQYSNFVSTAGMGSQAGCSATTSYYFRGSITGQNGFFFTTKFVLGDGNNELAYTTSGCRIFAGMTDQAILATTALNNPAGSRCGLSFCYASGGAAANRFDANWLWSVKDNTSETTGSLGMNFKTGYYRFSMYCPPFRSGPSGIFYQLDDLVRNSGVTGIMTGFLPLGNVALRPSVAITNISGGLRNLRLSNIYVESANGSFDSNSTNF